MLALGMSQWRWCGGATCTPSPVRAGRPGRELSGAGSGSLGGLPDLEDLGTADGAGAGGRRFAVLHGDRLSALDLALFLAFEAVASGHVLLRGWGLFCDCSEAGCGHSIHIGAELELNSAGRPPGAWSDGSQAGPKMPRRRGQTGATVVARWVRKKARVRSQERRAASGS